MVALQHSDAGPGIASFIAEPQLIDPDMSSDPPVSDSFSIASLEQTIPSLLVICAI